MLFKKTGLQTFRLSALLCAAGGIACVFLLDLIPEGILELTDGLHLSQLPAFIVCGIALAVAVIVPGVSFSHMLMIFGIYERFYQALSSLDVVFLLCIGIPTAIALLALIRLFDYLLKKFPAQSYSAILGFVVASVKDIFKSMPADVLTALFSLAALLIGIAVVFAVTGFFNKKQDIK
jgi:putative membrane protein